MDGGVIVVLVPDYNNIGGLAYASCTLTSTTICIGWSDYGNTVDIRKYTAFHKMGLGGQ